MTNVKPALSDKKFTELFQKSQPIGCLAEIHPKLYFASVFKTGSKYIATGFGGTLELVSGTKVKLWSGEIVTI
jgi:hypothetical protein